MAWRYVFIFSIDFRVVELCDVHGDVVFGQPFLEREKGTKLSKHQVIVESYRPLNGTVAEIRFFIENPEFDFHPGQYILFLGFLILVKPSIDHTLLVLLHLIRVISKYVFVQLQEVMVLIMFIACELAINLKLRGHLVISYFRKILKNKF